ncbi:MAG TPA: hypothetical protein VEQ40_10955 [Pyrinomonadaceae bacterium]|nr:hypothetical protein [Pyrinomonadaceae bacterium]
MDVRAEDFIPMINAHFLFRLVSRSAQYAKSHFDELTLAMHGDQLAVDVGGASFKVPAWGSWPSPIAVNSKSFTSAARAVSEDYVLFQYAAGKLEFGGRRLDAREI